MCSSRKFSSAQYVECGVGCGIAKPSPSLDTMEREPLLSPNEEDEEVNQNGAELSPTSSGQIHEENNHQHLSNSTPDRVSYDHCVNLDDSNVDENSLLSSPLLDSSRDRIINDHQSPSPGHETSRNTQTLEANTHLRQVGHQNAERHSSTVPYQDNSSRNLPSSQRNNLPDRPPEYHEALWYNTRSIDDDIPLLYQSTGDSPSTTNTIQTPQQPQRLLSSQVSQVMMTPRTVILHRNTSGFGFSVAGTAPVHIAHVTPNSPAASHGLQVGERLLEVNNIDVKTTSLDTVEAILRGATTLVLTLGPAPPPSVAAIQQQPDDDWRAAFQALNGDSQPDTQADSTTNPPPSGLSFAMCSFLCCPLVGAVAIWHALRVAPMWRQNDRRSAYMHAVKARKFASSAMFYGFLLILIYIFASSQDAGV
eukprot:gene7991-716_t